MFAVTFVQLLPPSRVTCTRPSFVPGPDEPLLRARFGDRVDDVAVFDADVVRREAAGDLLVRLVVAREVGTDHVPRAAAVGGGVHELAAGVDRVVVVRRDRERRVPHEAVLHVGRGVSAGAERPHFHVLALCARALVEPDDDAAAASRSRRGGPDEVRVDRIRRGPAALAAFDAVPFAARDLPAAPAVARPAIRRAVLLVAVDVVRNARCRRWRDRSARSAAARAATRGRASSRSARPRRSRRPCGSGWWGRSTCRGCRRRAPSSDSSARHRVRRLPPCRRDLRRRRPRRRRVRPHRPSRRRRASG